MTDNALFSPGLVKSGVRRFWPLWLAYLICTIVLVVMPTYSLVPMLESTSPDAVDFASGMDDIWSYARYASLALSFAFPLVMAIVTNEGLFDSRAATFVGSLPLRRRTVFLSNWASGLLPLLCVPTMGAILLLPLMLLSQVSIVAIVSWWAFVLALNFVFYSVAQLCCHLSGVPAVAVVLYGVANFLAVCLEVALHVVATQMLYGVEFRELSWAWLSPFIKLSTSASFWPQDLSVLGTYLVASVVMNVLAAIVYERRDLESAGVSVSFRPLRAFLVGLAGISMALLFAVAACLLRELGSQTAPMSGSAAAILALVTCVGGALGVVYSEMVMVRSTHLQPRAWRTALAAGVACGFLILGCHFDVLGLARYVPDPTQVAQVQLQPNYQEFSTLTSTDAIANTCELQRDLIAFGMSQDGDSIDNTDTMDLYFSYTLRDGRLVERRYTVPNHFYTPAEGSSEIDEGTRLVERFAALLNTPEARASRYERVLGEEGASFSYSINYNDAQTGSYRSLTLSSAERADFIEHALKPDLMDEPAGEVLGPEETVEQYYDVSLEVLREDVYSMLYLTLSQRSTPHIVAWLQEHHPEVELTLL